MQSVASDDRLECRSPALTEYNPPRYLPKPHPAPLLIRGGGGNPQAAPPSLTHAIAHQVEILLLLAAHPAPPGSQRGVGMAGDALRVRRATARLAGGMTGWVRRPTLVRLLVQSSLKLSPPRKASPYQHQRHRLLLQKRTQNHGTAAVAAESWLGRLSHPPRERTRSGRSCQF